MHKAYPAVFHHEEDGYWVEFPDLPGCMSEGETIAEAIQEASAALGAYLASNFDRDIPMAAPSDIRSITAEGENFVSIVAADPAAFMTRTRSIKKTLTIPEWLNDAAERRHINFSSVLQQALVEHLT